MRILHVIHTPRFSGAEILVATLTKVHKEMGHESCVVSFNPPEKNFESIIYQQQEDGIEWISPSKPLHRLARALFIRKSAVGFSPDVTFAHSVIPAAYARLAGIKTVVSVLHSETNYESGYVRFFEKFLQYRLKGVISVSDIARKKYTESFPFPRIRFIPNGVLIKDIKNSHGHRDALRVKLGFTKLDFVVIQVGRIDKIKQQHLSLEAIIPLIKNNKLINLLLVGLVEDKSYLNKLKDMVQHAGVERNVHFLGTRNDIANLLCAADLFLMPSLREAQGIAMVEALVAGLPIVASQIPGFEFTREFDGVSLLNLDKLDNLGLKIMDVFNKRQRYTRDLDKFDIRETATAYIEFGKLCMS